MPKFNFDIPVRPPYKPTPINRAQAIIIFRAISGLGLRDAHDIVRKNFTDFDVNPRDFGNMLAAWIREKM